eukprot:5663389-Pyramimonas_sp.AAC.1
MPRGMGVGAGAQMSGADVRRGCMPRGTGVGAGARISGADVQQTQAQHGNTVHVYKCHDMAP